MMDSNMRDDSTIDFDLNQEPVDPPTGSVLGLGSSLLNELETAHDRIEERIRQLEAVTARARQRQMWRLQARNPPDPSNASIEPNDNTSREGPVQNVASLEGIERFKSCKRDSSHLIAKALELDTDVKKVIGDGGGFFDCNICLDMAREPILTCCGHLFCWPCFYQLPYVYLTAKECPVCKGEVTDRNITPIYGNGDSNVVSETESGLKVPPRPRAYRVDSVRQRRVNRGVSHVPVAEALRRIRIGIGATGEQRPRQDLNGVSIRSDSTNVPIQIPTSDTEVGGIQDFRSRHISRVLSDNADSLLSISSALSNAERLVDDLESYIQNRVLGRSRVQVLSFGGVDAVTGTAPVVQLDSPAEITSLASPLASDAAATVIDLTEFRPSPSSRRRIRLPRVSDVDNGASREPRRRRLN